MTDQPTDITRAGAVSFREAERVYETDIVAARKRYEELTLRSLSAKAAGSLRERGDFDASNLGHRLVGEAQPLSAAEYLELMAIGEVLARYYRHPSGLDDAVRAGASWAQIGDARGTSAGQARADYREWAEGQHNLLSWTEGRMGMSDAQYAAALERASLGEPESESDREAWGGRGPSASYAEWLAEGQEQAEDDRAGTEFGDCMDERDRGEKHPQQAGPEAETRR